jgi:hypothetical protein
MPNSDIKRCRCKPNCNVRITRRQRHRHYAQAQYEGRSDLILPSESDSESSEGDDSSRSGSEEDDGHQKMANYHSIPATISHPSHNQSMQFQAGHTDMMDVDPSLESGSSDSGSSDSEDESDESDEIEGAEFDAAALAYNEHDDIDVAVTMEQLVQELEAELYLEDQVTFQNIRKRSPLFVMNQYVDIFCEIRQ